MSYSIETRPEELIVIATFNADFNVQKETASYADELKNKLEQMPGPSSLITHVDLVSAGFGDLVSGLGLLTQGKLAVLSHPNIKEIIVVTTKDLFSLGAKALGQSQYGGLRVSVARTLEEAIELAKQEHVSR
jgi:hypothetical protein